MREIERELHLDHVFHLKVKQRFQLRGEQSNKQEDGREEASISQKTTKMLYQQVIRQSSFPHRNHHDIGIAPHLGNTSAPAALLQQSNIIRPFSAAPAPIRRMRTYMNGYIHVLRVMLTQTQ